MRKGWLAAAIALFLTGAISGIAGLVILEGAASNNGASNPGGETTPSHEEAQISIDRGIELYTGLLVVVTAILGAGTFLLWVSTRKLAHDAETAAKHQLRAYIAVDFDPPGVDRRGDISGRGIIAIRLGNVGRTPADILDSVFTHITADKPPSYPRYVRRKGRTAPKLLLAPGQEYVSYEVIESLNEPMPRHYIMGYIDYQDIFGKKWRTGFARWYKLRRDSRALYPSDQRFDNRMNLVPMDKPWFNYDRRRSRSKRLDAEHADNH